MIKNINIINHLLLPALLYNLSAITSRKPVLTSDLLITKIAPITMTALLLNPLKACSASITLNSINVPIAHNAVTSKGTHSLKNEIAETTILDVLWKKSRHGLLKPRIQYTPVNLCGATLQFATAFNAKYVKDNNIGPGARIKITRSGDVIPYITEVLKGADEPKFPDYKYEWSKTGVDIKLSDNDLKKDSTIKLRKIVDFFKVLGIQGLKEKTVQKIYDAGYNNIKIINRDVLNIVEENNLEQNIIVFGNLPYNVSTKILASLILLKKWPPWYEILILMFQKEVAERIIAKTQTKEFGRLSVLSNWRLEIKKHFNISKNCFYPKPKVNSTILSFQAKEKDIFPIKNPKNLEMITRIFFSNRRKMINKNFVKLFKNKKSIANELNLDLNLRPEQLSCEMYYKITAKYEKLFG